MKKLGVIGCVVSVFVVVVSHCSNDDDDGFGGLEQLCYGDRSCDPGLTCRGNGVCVNAAPPHDAGPSDLRRDQNSAMTDTNSSVVDAGSSCWLQVFELEELELNEYWAACPGEACEDDRSTSASSNAHLVTYEGHYSSDASAALSTRFDLPSMGNYWVWARSVRSGPGRSWGLSIGAFVDSTDIGIEQNWQRLGPFALPAGATPVRIRDSSPDALWAYPDVLIVVNSEVFDPSSCAEGGVQAAACENWCETR